MGQIDVNQTFLTNNHIEPFVQPEECRSFAMKIFKVRAKFDFKKGAKGNETSRENI